MIAPRAVALSWIVGQTISFFSSGGVSSSPFFLRRLRFFLSSFAWPPPASSIAWRLVRS